MSSSQSAKGSGGRRRRRRREELDQNGRIVAANVADDLTDDVVAISRSLAEGQRLAAHRCNVLIHFSVSVLFYSGGIRTQPG